MSGHCQSFSRKDFDPWVVGEQLEGHPGSASLTANSQHFSHHHHHPSRFSHRQQKGCWSRFATQGQIPRPLPQLRNACLVPRQKLRGSTTSSRQRKPQLQHLSPAIQGISQHSLEGRSPCPERFNTTECHKASPAAFPAGKGQRSWNDMNSTQFPNTMLTARSLERELLKAHFTHTHTRTL